jgi:hypothetical protein
MITYTGHYAEVRVENAGEKRNKRERREGQGKRRLRNFAYGGRTPAEAAAG